MNERILQGREKFIERMDAFARGIDNYLGGEADDAENNTRLILKTIVDWSKHEQWQARPEGDFRLHLPAVEEKVKLRFTNYDTDEDEQGIRETRFRPRSTNESYGLGLFFMSPFQGFNFTYRPRLRFSDRLEINHLFRLAKTQALDHFYFEHCIEFFGRAETGMGQYYSLGTFLPFKEIFILGFVNEVEYVSHGSLFSSNHDLFLNMILSEKQTLRPGILVEADNQPDYRLQRYVYYISYAHEIRKDFLRYKLTPRFERSRIYDFEDDYGALLELAVIF